MQQYLEHSQYIDRDHPAIQTLAGELKNKRDAVHEDEVIARDCFVWVRDQIKHSADYKLNPVTCRASDVLMRGTGYCYAKSHLLAALLRACEIPAGLCYQRLSRDDNGAPYCLHGLNAVFLRQHGWYRTDPRGNTPFIHSQFTPPMEQLAFPTRHAQEADLPEIWNEPHPVVIRVLERYSTYDEVWQNLPDVALLPPAPSRKIIDRAGASF